MINDFSLSFSTINGSGSATANITILRALNKMGVPASGKNIFPSNIQGSPTKFTIRVNGNGFVGREELEDIIVCMNPSMINEDINAIKRDGVVLYPDHFKLIKNRDDLVYYPMPVRTLISETNVPKKYQTYLENMVYVGIITRLLNIQVDLIKNSLEYHFIENKAIAELNFSVIQNSYTWALENINKSDFYSVKFLKNNEKHILITGNEAAALGAIFGGVQFIAWYPITPSSGIPEYLGEYLPKYRKDPVTGKNTFAIVQAEDEIAAIGMATGAGWAGLRALTATSGPGLSLMTEFAGLAYYAEIPIVIWDVQRVGPSTGLPTRTSQGDLIFTNFMGHGDTQSVILLPGNVKECFEYGWRSFDIAERLQTPVFVLSDLDLGMNHWVSEPFVYPDKLMDRGKILWEMDIKEFQDDKDSIWGRYLDIDKDGIPYRTVIGNQFTGSSYFTRGTGHDDFGHYSEDTVKWEMLMKRLKEKFSNATDLLPKPFMENHQKSNLAILAYGSTRDPINEAIFQFNSRGVKIDFLRIRSMPFSDLIEKFIKEHKKTYIIEINRDGQLYILLKQKYPHLFNKLISISHLDGLPLTSQWIINAIKAEENI